MFCPFCMVESIEKNISRTSLKIHSSFISQEECLFYRVKKVNKFEKFLQVNSFITFKMFLSFYMVEKVKKF